MTPEEAYEEALRRIEEAVTVKSNKLVLYDLPLAYLPIEISRCTTLEIFHLGFWDKSKVKARITTLPHTIGQLTMLRFLDLSGIGLTSLPITLSQLTNLQVLVLYNNNLTSIPEIITYLTTLRRLDLRNNDFTNLPETISRLINLRTLDIRNNNLTQLPLSITQLANLRTLDLRNNPHLPIPPELVANPQNPQAILAYWQAQKKELARPLREAKIILVGQGGVGKTSLVQRLVFGKFNPNENATKGIQIDTWHANVLNINTSKQQIINVHLWDFGGQEILHATHQFFLTQRTLYLLVLDARQGERESRVEYWLTLINSFAGESPVLIVINKSDQHHLDLNRRGLQQKYPNIVGFVRTSAAKGFGIEELRIRIQQTLAQLPHLDTLFPRSWWTIKEKLETLQQQRDFLPYDEYRQLCRATGLNDDIQQRTLIGFLHDLGIALNFQDDDRVRDTNILNPEWVTQGVYALITNPQLAKNGGVLARSQVSSLLDPIRYPPERQGFILRMMEKFELAYPLEKGIGYLVPDLLPVEEPVFTWDDNDALHFVYHYHILPHSILHRFMVRQQDKICESIAWRTGVMLAYEGMKALIKADIEDGKILIAVTGGGKRREFLGMLRFTFASLHQNLTGTKPEEHLPIPGYPSTTIPYNFLLELENDSESFIRWPGVAEKIDVRALLGTIETPSMRQQASLSRREILDQLSDALNQEEVRTLCFDLGVNYDDLPGEGRIARLRELVVLMEKRGRIPELLSALNQLS